VVRLESAGRGRPSAQDTGTSLGWDKLARELCDFARVLQQFDDPDATLVAIVGAAVRLIPGCDEGSVSVVLGRRKVTSLAPSGLLPQVVDAIQEETQQGPCTDAAYEQHTVRVSDMANEPRWPLFTARALEAGAASMLSFQLYVEGDNLGALNLFSRTAGSFTDHSEHVGLMVASHAAIAYAAALKLAKMCQTVETRQFIGQAQGILMERHKITGDQSFELMRKGSQDSNLKLREIADGLILSGELPETLA